MTRATGRRGIIRVIYSLVSLVFNETAVMNDLALGSAAELAAMMRNRKISPVEVMRATTALTTRSARRSR